MRTRLARSACAVVAACVLAGPGASQDPPPGAVPVQPGPNPAAEGGGLAIGRRLFDALNEHRVKNGVPKAPFSTKAYIALQDHMDALVKQGYRGGPPGKKYEKAPARARERHGWNLTLFDNYTNGRKSSMSPAELIALLQAHPQIKSMLRTDLNAGASAATEVPGTEDLCIVVAMSREPKSWLDVRAKVDAAEAALAGADGAKRRTIAKAMGGLGDPEGLLLLTALLADPEAEVRLEAARACGALADCWPVAPLLDLLEKDPDAKVKAEARKALEAISGHRDYKDEIAKWRAWWEVERDAFRKK